MMEQSPHQARLNPPLAYLAERRPDGTIEAWVERQDGGREPLPHLVHHSPTGFEFGYAGSGPADLARSIIGHYLNQRDPHPAVYQPFKFAFIAGARGNEPLRIPVCELSRWLAENAATFPKPDDADPWPSDSVI